jgi:hypothetical protein
MMTSVSSRKCPTRLARIISRTKLAGCKIGNYSLPGGHAQLLPHSSSGRSWLVTASAANHIRAFKLSRRDLRLLGSSAPSTFIWFSIKKKFKNCPLKIPYLTHWITTLYYALQFVRPIASLKSYHVTIQQSPVSDPPTEWKLYRIITKLWWIMPAFVPLYDVIFKTIKSGGVT